MSIHFSRSMRSLNIDSFQASRVGLIVGIGLVFALIIWFLFAKVSMYAVSQEVGFNQDGRFVATFSKEEMARVQVGQEALVRIFSATDQPPLVIPGFVFDIPHGGQEAEILVTTEELPENSPSQDITGQVEVEVERITPLALVLRTSGKYLSGNQLPVSPQTNESTQGK
jgi:hypothetical protein